MPQPTHNKSSVLVALFGVLGVSTIVAQADLIGHWFGFEASSAGVQPLRRSSQYSSLGSVNDSSVLSNGSHSLSRASARCCTALLMLRRWYHRTFPPSSDSSCTGLAIWGQPCSCIASSLNSSDFPSPCGLSLQAFSLKRYSAMQSVASRQVPPKSSLPPCYRWSPSLAWSQ